MCRLFLFLLAGFTYFQMSGQKANRADVEDAINYFHLAEASRLSARLSPEKDAPYFRCRILFIQFLVSGDPKLWLLFLNQSKSSLKILNKLSESDPEKRVMMAELFFLRGVGKIIDKKYVGSVLDIKSSCNLIVQNRNAFPDNTEQNKLLGIFQVGMSSIPRRLRWLSDALCFKGDLEEGLQNLEVASQDSRLLPSEALVILFYFEKNLLSKLDKALQRIEALMDKYPASSIYAYFRLSALLENRKVDAALAFCKSQESIILNDKTATEIPLWYYSRAKAHYFKLEFEEAIRYFNFFLDRFTGKTLHSDALFRKGMSLVLQNRYPEARRIFHQMAEVESSTFDEDEYASHMASIYRFQEPSEIDKDLFRARNLFDGGYYQQSLVLLENMLKQANLNENQKAELHYRLGRNLHVTENLDEAKQEYFKCTLTHPGQALWMKVYALYYLGQLAESDQDIKLAKERYRTALEFDNYDYQSGLEQRCKASLNRLNNQK